MSMCRSIAAGRPDWIAVSRWLSRESECRLPGVPVFAGPAPAIVCTSGRELWLRPLAEGAAV